MGAGSRAAAARATQLLEGLRAGGGHLRHMGADAAARHRNFGVRAELLFKGGIDEAFANFVENPEADGIVGVKLADLSGRETVVTDDDGNEWPLRDRRHLGYLRVQNAKAECEAKGPAPSLAPPTDFRRPAAQ